jgi:cephalosporin-C deacetylase-like acetyl esterase
MDRRSFLLSAGGGALAAPFAHAYAREELLWDLRKLVRPPAVEFGRKDGLLQEIVYAGEPLFDRPTRVFAYLGMPEGHGPHPAMVLVHGGGGRAFSDWALHWARRGYASIAMDLSGSSPSGKLPDGGPDQSDTVKFRPFDDADAHNMWTYHSIAAAIRAHSILAAQPQVDAKRIGVTGISWGGYLTCILAGVDARFRAAVPVYGCGFLHENSVWKEPVLDRMPSDQRERWVRLFDPSRYLPRVKCPILFLNGTNDFAYPMDSYRKSVELVKAPKTVSVQIRLPHGHIWTFPIVDAFLDSHLNKGRGLLKLGPLRTTGRTVSAAVSGPVRAADAELYYTTDTGRWQNRVWNSAPAQLHNGIARAELPNSTPISYQLAVKDERGLIVTTTHAERG